MENAELYKKKYFDLIFRYKMLDTDTAGVDNYNNW